MTSPTTDPIPPMSPDATATKRDLNDMARAVMEEFAVLRRLSILIAMRIGLTKPEIDAAISGEEHEPGPGVWQQAQSTICAGHSGNHSP